MAMRGESKVHPHSLECEEAQEQATEARACSSCSTKLKLEQELSQLRQTARQPLKSCVFAEARRLVLPPASELRGFHVQEVSDDRAHQNSPANQTSLRLRS